jgi:type IV pilus assembly protein PilM
MPEMIGLDVGSHSMKLVGLKMTSKGPFLTRLGMKEIPYGTGQDDINTLSEILKGFVKEVGLKTKKVSLIVAGSGVHIKRIPIPSLPKAELREAVRWEIKNYLPFPVETAQIDFYILNQYVEDNVKKLDLVVVACPKHLIDRTLSIVEGAGLQPIHLDIAPFALWNVLLAWDQLKKEETVALIDLGAEKTGIYIFRNRILQFSREVTPAGADMTRAIMEGIGSVEEPKLLYERAESIKREIGIPLESYQEGMSNKSTSLSKISFFVRPVLEKIVADIGRSLDYYRNQFNEERIDRVLLTGGGANSKNIVTYLGSELRLPVEHFNPLKSPQPSFTNPPLSPLYKRGDGGIKGGRGGILFDSEKIDVQLIDQADSAFTIAVGLPFTEPKRIELLPAEEPFLSKILTGKSFPVLAPLITFLIFSGIIWYMNGQVRAIQKERDVKMAKVANLDTLQTKLKLLREKDLQMKEKLSQFPSSMMLPVPYRDILRHFNGILPDNVTLTLLSVQSKGNPMKKGAPSLKPRGEESQKVENRELYIAGVAFGSDVRCLTALAQIIERLERSPLFKNVKLVSADETKLYTQPGAGFEIVCDIISDNPLSPPFNPPAPPLSKGGQGGITKGGLGGLGEAKR